MRIGLPSQLRSSLPMLRVCVLLAAARAFLSLPDTGMTAQEVGEKSIAIAADICVYTNGSLTVEVISG